MEPISGSCTKKPQEAAPSTAARKAKFDKLADHHCPQQAVDEEECMRSQVTIRLWPEIDLVLESELSPSHSKAARSVVKRSDNHS